MIKKKRQRREASLARTPQRGDHAAGDRTARILPDVSFNEDATAAFWRDVQDAARKVNAKQAERLKVVHIYGAAVAEIYRPNSPVSVRIDLWRYS